MLEYFAGLWKSRTFAAANEGCPPLRAGVHSDAPRFRGKFFDMIPWTEIVVQEKQVRTVIPQ